MAATLSVEVDLVQMDEKGAARRYEEAEEAFLVATRTEMAELPSQPSRTT